MNTFISNKIITLTRDCPAVLIPSGDPIILPTGSNVSMRQALGGSYTVYVDGNLVRIAGRDADAIGYSVARDLPETSKKVPDGCADENLVWAQLRTCYDPEIPINIVDLGLIYDCAIVPFDNGGSYVYIQMTLTAPGCGMGEILVEDVRQKIASIPNVTEVEVSLVFDPPWSSEMMSEAARLDMGMY
ncbi:MAG: putative Fe-S cluster assembly protein SufT [Nitrosopumilaceae archaeon]